MEAQVSRGRDRGSDERHEMGNKLGSDCQYTARNVRTRAVNGGTRGARGNRRQRRRGNELVSPARGDDRAEAGRECCVSELDWSCGSRSEDRVVAENHHGRRGSGTDICEWWQRRHA
jgi:hypothetical protein